MSQFLDKVAKDQKKQQINEEDEDMEEAGEQVGELESRLPGTTTTSNTKYTAIPKTEVRHFAHPGA